MRHLRLTREQESRLVTYLDHRIRELDRDNQDRIDADEESDAAYDNDRCNRAKEGGIFAQSNVAVPLTSMVVDHFATRSEQDVFGRDPIAAFEPEGPADTDLARGLNRFASYKLFKVGGVKDDLLESQHTIFRHRAQILKATYDEDVDEWDEIANIVYDSLNQQPVIILNHGYVVEGRDKFVPSLDIVTGQPVQQLEVDPTFILDPARHYWSPAPGPIRFTHTNYAGARSVEVDSDCFRAPNNARSLDESDCLIEYYDKPIWWARQRFLDRPWINGDQFTKKVRNQDSSRKTEDQRKDESKENLVQFDRDNAKLGIIEIWLERDVLSWGKPQRIVLWMEAKTHILIDYEYQKKVTPHGRHPYTAVAICKTKQYWWGPSIPELVKTFQEYIDLQFNRHSFRNSLNSNPIIGQNTDAIQEKVSFLEMKPGDIYTLEQGKTIQDWLQVFMIPKGDLDTQMLLDKVLEFVRFWLGISNLSQGDYSDVPQNTTLGGQEATLREASKLSRRWTRRQIIGYTEHFSKLVQILLVTMDPEEAYTYLEGDVTQMAFISAEPLKDLTVNARLEMPKESGVQSMQEQQLTLQTITQYVAYPPELQLIVRPVMKKILYLLGHDDVDALLPMPILPPVIDPMTGLPMPQQPGAALPPPGAEAPPPTEEAAAPAPAPAGGEVVPFSASNV